MLSQACISKTPIYAVFSSFIRFFFSSYKYPNAALVRIKNEHHASKLATVYNFSASDVKKDSGESVRNKIMKKMHKTAVRTAIRLPR